MQKHHFAFRLKNVIYFHLPVTTNSGKWTLYADINWVYTSTMHLYSKKKKKSSCAHNLIVSVRVMDNLPRTTSDEKNQYVGHL